MSRPTVPAERLCVAHTGAGKPCTVAAIKGGVVCVFHGGKAPQVRAAANERLREMIPDALKQLHFLMESSESDAVKLSAVKDVLDRAGLAGVTKIEHDVNYTEVKIQVTEMIQEIAKRAR